MANSQELGNFAQLVTANAIANTVAFSSNTVTIGNSAYFTANGNIGLGTSSPSSKLTIRLTDTSYTDSVYIVNSANTTGAWARIGFQAGSNYGYVAETDVGEFAVVNIANAALWFSTNNLERVRITAAGNVGVGTNSPASKIDISGNAAQNIVTVSASAVDCSAGNYFTKTASGGLTWTFTNVPASRSFIFALRLTNGGTGTQSWPASVVWSGGAAPVLQTSGTDVLIFITEDGGTTWRGVRGWKQA